MHTRNFNFSKIFTKSLSDVLIKGKGKGKSKCQLLAHECCLSANTFEKFINININGVPQ
jgi:hypothetical protein